MAVLDCGCGPGSITVDLAEIVAPTMMIADFAVWAEDPDTYWAGLDPAAIGWVEEAVR